VQDEVVAFSMGLEHTGSRFHALKVSTPSKILPDKDHFINILYCTYCINTINIFSHLQVKNKPHKGAILSIVMIGNNYPFCI
jgi:hypothetical protein